MRDERSRALIDEQTYREFIDGLELLDGAGAAFDREAMLRGERPPVFFGSAVTNFGVQLFLDALRRRWRRRRCRASPRRRDGERDRRCRPTSSFSGFVFKIQANMDPRHRDRVAFVRVCSGRSSAT